MHRLSAVTCLVFLGLGLCLWAQENQPDLKLRFSRFQHAEDLAESQFDAGVLRVTILSSRGIGRCTITPEENNWPDRVEIFFAGLTELESLQVESGRFSTSGSRRQSGQFPFVLLAPAPAARNHKAGDKPPLPAGVLNIQVRQTEGGVLVVLPDRFLAEKEALNLAWIDWLRI